jgi:hypothetical protein
MQQFRVKKYPGDEALAPLISAAGGRAPVEILKAAILGALASSEDRGIQDIFMEYFASHGGRPDERVPVEAIESLWYLLNGAERFPSSPHMQMDSTHPDRDALLDFVQRQVRAGETFFDSVNFGRIQDFFGDEKIAKIYTLFEANLILVREMHVSMTTRWGEQDFRDVRSLVERLNRFTQILWDTMITLKESVKAKKLERRKNQSVIRDIESQTGQEVRRNDQCPCGSGKKYKHCCGAH